MKISVVGIGYVGLVAAGGFAESGNHIICVDNDKKKIKDLKKGVVPIYEPGLSDIVRNNEKAGRLSFTTDLKQAVDNSQIIILGVGTPGTDDGSADISAVQDFMKPDRVIIGIDNPDVREVMKQLYAPFMRKGSRIVFMDSASAEM